MNGNSKSYTLEVYSSALEKEAKFYKVCLVGYIGSFQCCFYGT
jgi:hypothetical protein